MTFANTADVVAALRAAKGGDVIQLPGCGFAALTLVGLAAPLDASGKGVTLLGAPGCSFRGIILSGCANIALQAFELAQPPGGVGLTVAGSQGITADDLLIHGDLATTVGVTVSSTKTFALTNSRLHDVQVGVKVWASNGVALDNNDVRDFQRDGIDTIGTDGFSYTRNSIRNSHYVGGEHPDGMQFADNAAYGGACRNGEVRANDISDGCGAGQEGILLGGAAHRNIKITDNMIRTVFPNAILVCGDQITVTGNDVNGPEGSNPRIVIDAAATNVVCHPNVVGAVRSADPRNTIVPLISPDRWAVMQRLAGA